MLDILQKYLRANFGDSVQVTQIPEKEDLPDGLRDNYQCFWCYLLGHKIILLRAFKQVHIGKTKAYFAAIKQTTDYEPVLWLEKSGAKRRPILLTNQLSFFYPDKEMFLLLPDVLLKVKEGPKTSPRVPQHIFSAATQQVFLYLLYSSDNVFGVRGIAKELGLSPISVSRALFDFVSFNLVRTIGKDNHKKFIREEKKKFWEMGQEHLDNPLDKILYFKEMPDAKSYHHLAAGHSLYSGQQPPVIAISTQQAKRVAPEELLEDDYIAVDGCVIAQVWKYDPRQFGREGRADIASVYLTANAAQKKALEAEVNKMLCE